MADKVKVFRAGSEPSFPSKFEVTVRKTLNFTDIGENNNKYYNIELQATNGGKNARVYTQYGRVGAPNPAREYRVCDDETHANSVIAQIIKEKTKKGYVEIEMVKADLGSDVGKSIVNKQLVTEVDLKKNGYKVEDEGPEKSKLHPEVRSLVGTWFGATAKFIEANLDTKKCPLGQLAVAQLTKGRDILDQCRQLVHASGRKDITELNRLTSQYYSNIPHNFGYGRLDADALRFDSDEKIDKGFDILDIFADAKNAEKVMSTKSPVDAQYETLNADLDFIDPGSLLYKWLERILVETRASNHHFLGKIKLHRAFTVNRKKELDNFMKNVETIAKECGRQQIPEALKRHVPERPDIAKDQQDLFKRANVLPVWHGTRRANMVGITTKGLLIRPSGVPHAGSMFGDGIYWAAHSTKSINYTDVRGSYWAAGAADTAFLFLADCAFGNQRVVHNAQFFRKRDLGSDHSVWAKMGQALLNDELIVYEPTGPTQQHRIKYILEFSTKN